MGAPVEYANPGPMALSLAQGGQFARFHEGQHGGNAPYPGGVVDTMLSPDLVASSRTGSTLEALRSVQGLQDPSPSNPMGGGRRKSRKASRRNNRKSRKNRGSRKGRKASRKSRKNRGSRKANRKSRKNRSRKQRGGLVRWGGGRGSSGSRGNRGNRSYQGGTSQGSLDGAMSVGESGQMLIGPEAQQGAGLNPEWKLAENPMAFAPRS